MITCYNCLLYLRASSFILSVVLTFSCLFITLTSGSGSSSINMLNIFTSTLSVILNRSCALLSLGHSLHPACSWNFWKILNHFWPNLKCHSCSFNWFHIEIGLHISGIFMLNVIQLFRLLKLLFDITIMMVPNCIPYVFLCNLNFRDPAIFIICFVFKFV